MRENQINFCDYSTEINQLIPGKKKLKKKIQEKELNRAKTKLKLPLTGKINLTDFYPKNSKSFLQENS